MIPNLWNSGIRLAGLSDEDLMKLSQETGLAFPMLKAQQRAEMASTGNAMPGDEAESFVPTVEIRLITNAKNPRKARKKNIKMLRKNKCKAYSNYYSINHKCPPRDPL